MHFSPISFIAITAAALLTADTLAAPSSATKDYKKGNFAKLHGINKDVLIVGGGASGTYAAHKLLDTNKSVIVVEREVVTGGNTNTYYDPTTGTPVDYGVVVWHNNELVRKFFSRFNITLFNTLMATAAPSGLDYVDFRTGKLVTNYVPQDPTAALQGYYALLQQYPYLEKGFELPDPVPEDLLLPFGQFMQKHNLTDMSQFIYSFAQGLGNVLE
jgi:phytoene dehydrogenase-like protein